VSLSGASDDDPNPVQAGRIEFVDKAVPDFGA